MLTFELSPGGSLQIFFDAAGRDFLMAQLAELTEPGDHAHLFGPDCGGTELEKAVHHPERVALQEVAMGIPGAGLDLLRSEVTELSLKWKAAPPVRLPGGDGKA